MVVTPIAAILIEPPCTRRFYTERPLSFGSRLRRRPMAAMRKKQKRKERSAPRVIVQALIPAREPISVVRSAKASAERETRERWRVAETDMSDEVVLVTGGSGFVAVHCIAQLLDAGYQVRTTVRSLARETDVRGMLATAGVSAGQALSFV